MRLFSARQALVLVSACMLLTGTLSGCGRHGNPAAPSTSTSSDQPDPGDGQPADPYTPVDPGTIGDPGPAPADPAPAAAAPAAPANAAPAQTSAFRPLPKPTATPGAPSSGGGGDPGQQAQQDEQAFINLLQQFNFGPAFKDPDQAVEDVKTQLSPELRVPPSQFHWPASPDVQKVYQGRAKGFPAPISFQQWMQAGVALAQRTQSVSFYVARRPLYQDIITNQYTNNPPNQLVFYKRLDRTGYMVCYGPDGTVLDYGYWPQITWQDFLAVPSEFWQ
ncbi:MAG TPA: hypothetical protein V6D47_06630 [Oscillatoriaceae cyanobacterium]